jgi:hypothetical protein
VSITSSYAQRRTTGLGCCHEIKTTKINSEGFLSLSMKINTPENYPPYGSR